MKFKKLIFVTLIIFLFTGCRNDENTLVMVTEAGFAPYEYYENGDIVGVDIDIAKEIAKELGKELVIKDVAFDSIINEIKSGKADFGAAGISYSEERAKEVDFTIDYATSKQVIVAKKGISEIADFDDKRIAVQLGSVADSFVTKNFKNATIVRQKKFLAAIEDLKNDKVDLVIMDELPAKELIKPNPSLTILDQEVFTDKYGMVVKKGNQKLLDKINNVLKRLIKEGKIDNYVLEHTK